MPGPILSTSHILTHWRTDADSALGFGCSLQRRKLKLRESQALALGPPLGRGRVRVRTQSASYAPALNHDTVLLTSQYYNYLQSGTVRFHYPED